MREGPIPHFGLLIAYVVPGFVALWGISYLSPDIHAWLTGPKTEGPSVGGFLYVTVASISGGMSLNALRWLLVDSLHHATGLTHPQWSDAFLHDRIIAYEWLVENHYRHYQFYGNTLCGLIIAYGCWRMSLPDPVPGFGWLDGVVVALSLVLAAGSRSTLDRYYRRVNSLLGAIASEDSGMANGGHHPEPKDGKKKADAKADAAPVKPADKATPAKAEK